MVDVVWNDGSASGDFTSYKLRGDVVFRVLAQNYFLGVGIAWLWFVLVIQYVGFPEWQYIPFPVIRPCFA
jgi:hypothetical protein